MCSGFMVKFDREVGNAGVGLSDTATNVWVDLKGDADLTLKDAGSWRAGLRTWSGGR